MANEVHNIVRSDWVSRFKAVGRAKIGDYTFKIDEHSQRSSWIYNSMNLGIDCGEKYGNFYCNLMGGYSPERSNKIYVHGKDDNGNDDFKNRFEVDWDERFDDDVIEEIGDQCFIKVGLEQTVQGKNFEKRFLSAYDAIAYIKEQLTEDMVISVSGNIKYSMYNDTVQMQREITSIFLSKVEDPANFHATFIQSVLLDKDSVSMKDVDKTTGILLVNAIVLDYMKEFNGHEIRGQWPFNFQFEYEMNLAKPELCKKVYEKLFKVKKGYTQITFEGDFISGGGTIAIDYDRDVSDDIKELVELEIYTKEEAIEKCAGGGSREHHMFLRKPTTKQVGDGDDKTTSVQIFPEKYDEDELDISWAYSEVDDEESPFDSASNESAEDGTTGDEDMSWLEDL